MKRWKKAAAFALSLVMTLSVIQEIPVKAQVQYETKKVYISTDLVPEAGSDISVTKDGSMNVIEAKTNVQFDLDCNVDCTWKVEPDENLVPTAGTSTSNVKIDSMGHVTIARGASSGTYNVTAAAKRITNTTNKTAVCKINVDGASDPAKAKSIRLDKKAIEAQVPDGVVEVADDGTDMTVNGTVKKLHLYTEVSPAYLLRDEVNFESQNTTAAQISEAGDGTMSLFTSKEKTPKSVSLLATAGIDKSPATFGATINNCSYSAAINCDNIPADDKASNGVGFNIRLNEDLDFTIDDNESVTLPACKCKHVEWTMTYGDDTEIIENFDEDDVITTDLGTFTISDSGKSVNLKTPVENKNSDAYKKYIKKLESQSQIRLKAVIPYTVKDSEGKEQTSKYEVKTITLSFSNKVNSVTKVSLDFDAAGLKKNRDYAVVEENLNGESKVPVYYFESGDEDDNIIRLARATHSDVPGVRDFEEARGYFFTGNNANYEVTYTLTDLPDDTFGSAEATQKYLNNDLKESEINNRGQIITANRTLTKSGTGYKVLTISTSGKDNKKYEDQSYVLRFVSDAYDMELRHDDYAEGDNERLNKAVIHIRQGEADKPVIYLPTGSGTKKSKVVSLYNPFLEYTFTPLKGEGTIASATTDSMTKALKINGISTGKVIVTASSAVDKTETVSYVLYVNDENYTPDSIQIDTYDAMSMKAMDAAGNVKGRWTDIPLGITANGDNAGIPSVTWKSSDTDYATITADGKLTTLKSTGQNTVTITATSKADSSITATLELHILDVSATGVNTIEEKVAAGATAEVTPGGKNAGTCKANTTFTLHAKDYTPVNATKADGRITWESSKTDVATIDNNGVVKALAEGNTVITAKYTSGDTETSSTTYNLTVQGFAEIVTSIECASPVNLAHAGLTYSLTPIVKPANAVNKKLTYESLNKAVATVTDTGVITAIAPGTAVIVITSVAQPTVTARVQVIVADPTKPQTPTNVTPSNNNKNIKKPVITLSKKKIKRKKTAKIKIKNKAAGAKVTYKLNKKSKKIISVSKKGKIKGKKKGTATIVVTVKQNGKTYKKTLKIKVM